MKTGDAAIVLGLGRSGKAAARLLASEGIVVTAVDASAITWEHPGITVQAPMHDLPGDAFELAVVSPGISVDGPWVQALKERGVPCVSELEFGWSRCRARTLAITGSLGKSTVATFCHHCLEKAGRKSALAGNIGTPVSEIALEAPDQDVLVLEVSSFQCELLIDFHPAVAILLNLVPNHLDRHGDLATYTAMKARMFQHMGAGDVSILHEGAAGFAERMRDEKKVATEPAWEVFGVSDASGWTYDSGCVSHDGTSVVSLKETAFSNPVLGVNAAAAVAALSALDVSFDQIAASLRDFVGLPHRMQDLGAKNGVRFINDSKSTTLSSLAAAASMIDGPVHLLVGGIVKENDLHVVTEFLAKRPVKMYLFGRDADRLYQAWSGEISCKVSNTLQDALNASWSVAVNEETILLSPGCASFDQFDNYEHRGRCFAEYIEKLK